MYSTLANTQPYIHTYMERRLKVQKLEPHYHAYLFQCTIWTERDMSVNSLNDFAKVQTLTTKHTSKLQILSLSSLLRT